MFKMNLQLENFLAVKKAEIEINNNIVVLIAPNRAGKTQILQLLYGIFWCIWKIKKDNKKITKGNFEKEIKIKLKNIFLLGKPDDVLNWNVDKEEKFKINLISEFLKLQITGPQFQLEDFYIDKNFTIEKNAVFIQPAGMGDYYKGIYSLKKYYPGWKIVPDTIIDLIHDLFIVYTAKSGLTKEYKNLLKSFERQFESKFFIRNDRIFIQEREKEYGIERTASGLKSLSWFYLILKYNLLGNILFLDEPEVNLHPTYIDKLAYFLFEMSKNKQIFISTHSDYILESFNKLINKFNFKIDVWEGKLENHGGIYNYYEADKDNLIDTAPLIDTYLEILKEGFGYE